MTTYEKLDKIVSELLVKMENLKDENTKLRSELVALKSECEMKNTEITRIQELYTASERELTEIGSYLTTLESIAD